MTWDEAREKGYTHLVSYLLPEDDPKKPWKQNFYKSLGAAKKFANEIHQAHGRAIWAGMYSGWVRK